MWIGGVEFSNKAGELRYAAGVVEGDTDGDGTADFTVGIIGVLRGGDIIC